MPLLVYLGIKKLKNDIEKMNKMSSKFYKKLAKMNQFN